MRSTGFRCNGAVAKDTPPPAPVPAGVFLSCCSYVDHFQYRGEKKNEKRSGGKNGCKKVRFLHMIRFLPPWTFSIFFPPFLKKCFFWFVDVSTKTGKKARVSVVYADD